MNIRKFYLLTTVVSLSMILIFSVTGCMSEVTLGKATKNEAGGKEEPDKELFDRYFSEISLGGTRLGPKTRISTSVGDIEKNICILLPHQQADLGVGFKNNNNFTFKTAVLNLETNDFIERCATTTSSLGSDGLSIEGILLPVGKYDYLIYIENTLVAVLPFEVISYVDYFEAEIDKVKLFGTHFFENLREEK